MTIQKYRSYVGIVIKHLKKKYTNLSAEEAYKLATDMVDEMVEMEEVK